MDALRPFTIPLSGLYEGLHRYHFEVDDTFFACFDDSLIESGTFQVDMDLDKRHRLIVLDFRISGKEFTNCDRCLNPIRLPVSGEFRLYIKFGEGDEEEDDEVVFMPEGTVELDVSHFVYEFIGVSLPLVKIYECEDEDEPPCNFEVLARLNGGEESNDTDDSQEEDLGPWSELKKLNDWNKDKK